MTEHKHASVLRAIAGGVNPDNFEAKRINHRNENWKIFTEYAGNVIAFGEAWEVRRKQQHILVNGFKVPKPLDVMPGINSQYFVVAILSDVMFDEYTWTGCSTEKRWLEKGVLHATKEAAIAHAKAMLGIDPEAWGKTFT